MENKKIEEIAESLWALSDEELVKVYAELTEEERDELYECIGSAESLNCLIRISSFTYGEDKEKIGKNVRYNFYNELFNNRRSLSRDNFIYGVLYNISKNFCKLMIILYRLKNNDIACDKLEFLLEEYEKILDELERNKIYLKFVDTALDIVLLKGLYLCDESNEILGMLDEMLILTGKKLNNINDFYDYILNRTYDREYEFVKDKSYLYNGEINGKMLLLKRSMSLPQ